ncbi:hypothetical protein ACIHCQ_30190 [Streptomyces sp. NPDC052236]|uniref:hypothetical protein n=1 Tax=Streptomyces sp. NPDC052236 TaxID=3365686 RepID=UPI0037D10F7B
MSSNSAEGRAESRQYVSRGVDIRITEENGDVELRLDDMPVDVAFIDGEYHSQLANMFTGFRTIEELVDSLLEREGRTWTLRGGRPGGGGHGGGHHPPGGRGHTGGHQPHRGGGVR